MKNQNRYLWPIMGAVTALYLAAFAFAGTGRAHEVGTRSSAQLTFQIRMNVSGDQVSIDWPSKPASQIRVGETVVLLLNGQAKVVRVTAVFGNQSLGRGIEGVIPGDPAQAINAVGLAVQPQVQGLHAYRVAQASMSEIQPAKNPEE